MLKIAVLVRVSEVEDCRKPSYVQLSPLYLKFSLCTLDVTHVIKITRLSLQFFVWVKGHAIKLMCVHVGESLGTRLLMPVACMIPVSFQCMK